MAASGAANFTRNSAKQLSNLLIRYALEVVSASGNWNKGVEDDIEVRWMTTNNQVCTMPRMDPVYIADVRKKVHETSGIPYEQQCLFAEGEELRENLSCVPAGANVIRLVRSSTDVRVTNLGHFRPSSLDFPALPEGGFRFIREIFNGINGTVSLYNWREENGADQRVAVKAFKNDTLDQLKQTETNDREAHFNPRQGPAGVEDALTEIGILRELAKEAETCEYILKMKGVFSQGTSTLLVTEYAEGGELFDVAKSGPPLPEHKVKHYTQQLMEAVAFIHGKKIAHRDISLENVLLKGGVARLMDFGAACRTHSLADCPLRYFRAVGKPYYRPSEMYVPRDTQVSVVATGTARAGEVGFARTVNGYLCEVRWPEDVQPGSTCLAEPWGYSATPVDVFASAICLFILAWQCPPWARAMLLDPIFSYAYQHGCDSLLRAWKKQLLSPEAHGIADEPSSCRDIR